MTSAVTPRVQGCLFGTGPHQRHSNNPANLMELRGGLRDELLALQVRSGQSLLTESLVATGHPVPEALLIGLLDAALPCSTRTGLASHSGRQQRFWGSLTIP